MKAPATIAIATFLALLSVPANAQWEPQKPIRAVVGFGAGGTIDAVGRLVFRKIEEQKGWKFIVENKAGAQGALAISDVKNAQRDGLTIGLLSTGTFALDPYLSKNSSFFPEDVDYLGTISTVEYALVAKKDAPYHDLASLGEHTRKSGPVSFSSTNKLLELSMERIAKKFGINMVAAPTAGSAQSLQLVLGGHANLTAVGGIHVPYVQSGELKMIASLTSSRADYAPDVKTSSEQGADFAIENYFLFFAPKGLPPDIKKALADAIDAGVKSKEVEEYSAKTFNRRVNLGAEAATKDVMDQAAAWRKWLAEQPRSN